MLSKEPKPTSRYASAAGRNGIRRAPRVRHEASADLDDLRIEVDDPDVYERMSSEAYLGSSAIAASRKRRKRNKVLKIASASFLIAVLAIAGVALTFFGNLSDRLTNGLDSSFLEELMPVDSPEDPFYVLLLGTDKSQARDDSGEFGDAYRSDTMMLARIDPGEDKATIISIPRDLQVDLGEYGENKVNAAHYFGGPTLAVKTVSKLAGVPISHYAEIDLDGFANVVDTLGGIDVDVPISINDPEAGGSLASGRQTLNGAQALILCRSRHAYDDYGAGDLYRAANQRLVLSAIAQKLLSSDPITIASSVGSLADSVVTDMRVESIVGIAQSMRGLDASTDVYTAVVPTTSEYEDDVWYEVIDDDEWREMMRRVDAGMPPTEDDIVDDETGTILSSAGNGAVGAEYSIDRTQSINIRNGNGTAGLSADAQSILEGMGYRKFDVGNANRFDYQETLIVYKDAKNSEYAEQIAKALGHGRAIRDDGSYLFDSDYLIVIGGDWTL